MFLDEVPGMVETFGNDAKRSHLLPFDRTRGLAATLRHNSLSNKGAPVQKIGRKEEIIDENCIEQRQAE